MSKTETTPYGEDEVERILSLSDEEIMAGATIEDIEAAKKMGVHIKMLTRIFDAGRKCGIESVAKLFEDQADYIRANNIREIMKRKTG